MRIAGKALLIIITGIVIGGISFFSFYIFKINRIEKEILEYEGEISGSFLYELEILNPSLLSWQEIATTAPWSPRDSHAAVVYKDKIWLMGGLNGNDYVVSPGVVEYGKAPHFSDIWTSEDGINWNLVTDEAPWGKRRSIQAIVFQDKIWVIPGWGPETGLQSNTWSSQDGINWEQAVINGPWPQREGHQLAVFDEKLWLIGGVDYDKRKTKNDVWYSEDGLNWVEAVSEAPWPSRWDHKVIAFKEKLWLIGGMDLKDNVFGDVWVSENGKDWSSVTDNPLWSKRQGHEVVLFQDRIWLVGRFNEESQENGNNDIWFSADGINWQKTEKDPPWSGREDHAAVVFQDKIWVLGGMDSDWEWKNDIWHSVFYLKF